MIFTFDHSIIKLWRNFQADNPNTRKVIDEALTSRLPSGCEGRLSVDFHNPSAFSDFGDYLDSVAGCIAAFNPSCVMKWYGFYQSIYFASGLFEHFPVIGLQFNAGNPIDMHADLLLAQGDTRSKALDLVGGNRWRDHVIPLDVFERREILTRADAQMGKDDVVMVSAMTGGRLDQAIAELTADEARDLSELFERHPNLHWHLVAAQDPDRIKQCRPELAMPMNQGRIHFVPLLPDLRAYIAIADLYLQLPGMRGGGMSAAMAVVEDKPLIAFSGTDPCNFLPDETIFDAWPDYVSTLSKCLTDPQFSENFARQQRRYLTECHSSKVVGRSLLAHIAEATEIAKIRRFQML
ncbi:glycosyltransferase family 1 protein [Henriciella mobilis]|nr:glycosyltransferase family 1 protein [Henriciella mobilis]